MKFCTGWYRQTDGQQRYWDGQASAAPDHLAEPRRLTGLRDAGVVSEEELVAKKAQILSLND